MNTVENVLGMLEDAGIGFRKEEHEPVTTSQEAAKVRGVDLKTGVKALLLKTKEGEFIMVLVPADQKVDTRKIAEMENTKKVSFASAEEVMRETGCEIGGVPPFGHTKNSEPNKIKTYISKGVFDSETANFNAGSKSVSVSMKSKDLEKVVDAILF